MQAASIVKYKKNLFLCGVGIQYRLPFTFYFLFNTFFVLE